MGTSRNASSTELNNVRDMTKFEWKTVGILPSGVKLIQHTTQNNATNPQFSHSSKVYASANPRTKKIEKIVFYNSENKRVKELNWGHKHGTYEKEEIHVHYDVNNRNLVRSPNHEELVLYEEAMEYNKKYGTD